MRGHLALLILVLLSGCASPGTGNPGASGASEGPLPELPAPLVFTGSLQGAGAGAFDNVLPVQAPPCPLGDRQCVTHAVEVPPGLWQVTFWLSMEAGPLASAGTGTGWSTDYDLEVEGVGSDPQPALVDEVVRAVLPGGTYPAHVVAWHDTDGSYTLRVEFEQAPSQGHTGAGGR